MTQQLLTFLTWVSLKSITRKSKKPETQVIKLNFYLYYTN
jgi:hypothetical protein